MRTVTQFQNGKNKRANIGSSFKDF